jgi:hypothetical protein
MRRTRISLGISLALSLAIAPLARGQSGGAYDLSWNTIAAGGATGTSGGAYGLSGTAGEIDAGASAGGAYALLGGFWAFGGAAVTPVGGPGGGDAAAPLAFRLHAGTPNPFQHRTTLAFDLPKSTPARASVYNVSGALVRTLLDGPLAAGRHSVSWAGDDDAGNRVAQGVYLLRLEAGAQTATSKLIFTR